MTRRGLWLRLGLLSGVPFLMAAISAAATAIASKGWLPDSPLLLLLFRLNVALAVAGSALSGMIGRDSPAGRVRGALDCGAFGLFVHILATIAVVAALPSLGIPV